MKEERSKEHNVTLEDPLASEQQQIEHDHIRQARGELLDGSLDDLADNFEPGGYKELMKI